jgi:hypothetical protein
VSLHAGESRFRSALKSIAGTADGAQTFRAQRDELFQGGLGVTGSQRQLQPGVNWPESP